MKDSELSENFSSLNTSGFPDFHNYKKTLERGLWVLWIAKDKLGIRKLTAAQIVLIIRHVKEISIDEKSIIYAFNRANDKIHSDQENGKVCYEIMKPGKDFLISQINEGFLEVLYFEPNKHFTSKKLLTKNILDNINGEMRIVDPYCGERTLDVLGNLKNRDIKFMTKVDNLRDKDKERLLRELKDFKLEKTNIEFRNYPHTDIHDRYIISDELLVILGHSIKDLGSKESFAIVFRKEANKNVVEALAENFNRRWKQSTIL